MTNKLLSLYQLVGIYAIYTLYIYMYKIYTIHDPSLTQWKQSIIQLFSILLYVYLYLKSNHSILCKFNKIPITI